MRILVTGAAGAVGSTVAAGLKGRHTIRGHDRVPMPNLDDAIVGDLADFDSVLEATRGMDAVMHIGATPHEAPWEDILNNNIIGTYNVFEAASRNGVRRIAFASRAGVIESYPVDVKRTIDLRTRPDSYYSASKLLGESLGWMYSVKAGIGFVGVRIGGFRLDKDEPGHPHSLGHGDAVRVFEQAVIHPNVTYEIVYGVSDSNWPLYDLDHGRKSIGYYPQQKSNVPEDQWK